MGKILDHLKKLKIKIEKKNAKSQKIENKIPITSAAFKKCYVILKQQFEVGFN